MPAVASLGQKGKPMVDEGFTDTIFREYPDGEVIAIFPGIAGTYDPRTVMFYAHLGQHGHGDYAAIVSRTRLAKDSENLTELHNELRRIGYNVRPVKRGTSAHFRERLRQSRGE